MGLNSDLLEQMAFYGSYHRNKWNQLIHFIFVPIIVWTIFVWLNYTGPIIPSPEVFPSYAVLNATFVVAALYSIFYILLDPAAGISWCLLVGCPMWLTSNMFSQEVEKAWAFAIPIHVLSWYMQIHPGHAILEKRKPALLDSLVQAFALAPLFVWFELLFMCNYRPGFKRKLDERIENDIRVLQHKEE